MAEERDVRIAMSLLDEVEQAVDKTLGNQIAFPYDPDIYNAERDIWSQEMVEQCQLAEKKASDSKDVSLRSNILKAQIYGCWAKPTGQRGTHNKAVECYEEALSLGGDEAQIRYRMALLYRVHAQKNKAIENLERVIQIAGEDSELGIESAKELEKEKAKKGGCFIATAVYGSYDAPEVLILRDFRDKYLVCSPIGLFIIKIYYKISPALVSKLTNPRLKSLIRKYALDPLVKCIDR